MGVILIKAFLVCRDFVDNTFIRNSFKENCLAFEYYFILFYFILFYFLKKGGLIVFSVKCYIQRNDFWKNVISSDCLKLTLIDFLNFKKICHTPKMLPNIRKCF